MRIGVVSDTHGHLGNSRTAARMLAEQQVELIIHCGDIGSPAVVPLFADWPAHFVFGNVDSDEDLLHEAITTAGQTCHGRFGSLELSGRRIAFLHSDDRNLFEDTISDGQFDLVCYGHTHVAEQHRTGETLVLNPGALYRASPHTFAVVDLPDLSVTHIPLES